MSTLPRYDELPVSADKPDKSSWGVWGDDDQVGTINVLTEESVLSGAACVRTGKVFPLNWDLELPDPAFFGRQPLKHTIVSLHESAHDDYYDSFYPQQSSQWDSLSHVGHPEHGFYNGRTSADFTGKPGSKNGIDQWATRGIVGRGVLLDVERYFAATGASYDPSTTVEITVDILEAVAKHQGTTFQEGDLLMLRTGWMGWYERADAATRADLGVDSDARITLPGFAAGDEMLRFFWDNHFAAAATDTPTFEAWPHQMVPGGYLHFDLLAMLGFPLGEMFSLEGLAADCAADGRYEFLFTSAPLNKVGGVGSPPNAIAIK
jgi:kynurenine formamidase